MALDALGGPHISYYDASKGDLKYAYYDNNAWQIQTVDSEGDVGQDPSMVLDTKGNPHISYFDYTNGDLKYAYLETTSVLPETGTPSLLRWALIVAITLSVVGFILRQWMNTQKAGAGKHFA